MSEETRTLELVLANTRQQLSQAMASNAELAALLQQTREALSEVQTPSSDASDVKSD